MALVTNKIQLYFKLTKPCYSSSFADGGWEVVSNTQDHINGA